MVEGNILTHLNASAHSEHDTKGIVVNCAVFKHYTPELYLQENENPTFTHTYVYAHTHTRTYTQ